MSDNYLVNIDGIPLQVRYYAGGPVAVFLHDDLRGTNILGLMSKEVLRRIHAEVSPKLQKVAA